MKNDYSQILTALGAGKTIEYRPNAVGAVFAPEDQQSILRRLIVQEPADRFRVRPDYLNVSSFRIPAPMTEAPVDRATYYTIEACIRGFVSLCWQDDSTDRALLAAGRVWATEDQVREVVAVLGKVLSGQQVEQPVTGSPVAIGY